MLKYFLFAQFLIPAIICYFSSFASAEDPVKASLGSSLPAPGIFISVRDYIELKPSDFKRLTGRKLTFKELIAFWLTQRKFKKAIRRDGSENLLALQRKPKDRFKWNWGGFFLGFLLPGFGIIVSLFIKDNEKRNRITTAAIGTLTVLTAGMIILIIELTNDL